MTVRPSGDARLSSTGLTSTGYASQRLVRAIIQGSRAPHDLKTLAAWAQEVDVSCATLRAWCYAARERPKLALDFVRVLRAVILWHDVEWRPFEAFDTTVPNTLRRLFQRGNVEYLVNSRATPSQDVFVRQQHYLRNDTVIEALLAEIWRKT